MNFNGKDVYLIQVGVLIKDERAWTVLSVMTDKDEAEKGAQVIRDRTGLEIRVKEETMFESSKDFTRWIAFSHEKGAEGPGHET
jgi:hypothetical protein